MEERHYFPGEEFQKLPEEYILSKEVNSAPAEYSAPDLPREDEGFSKYEDQLIRFDANNTAEKKRKMRLGKFQKLLVGVIAAVVAVPGAFAGLFGPIRGGAGGFGGPSGITKGDLSWMKDTLGQVATSLDEEDFFAIPGYLEPLSRSIAGYVNLGDIASTNTVFLTNELIVAQAPDTLITNSVTNLLLMQYTYYLDDDVNAVSFAFELPDGTRAHYRYDLISQTGMFTALFGVTDPWLRGGHGSYLMLFVNGANINVIHYVEADIFFETMTGDAKEYMITEACNGKTTLGSLRKDEVILFTLDGEGKIDLDNAAYNTAEGDNVFFSRGIKYCKKYVASEDCWYVAMTTEKIHANLIADQSSPIYILSEYAIDQGTNKTYELFPLKQIFVIG